MKVFLICIGLFLYLSLDAHAFGGGHGGGGHGGGGHGGGGHHGGGSHDKGFYGNGSGSMVKDPDYWLDLGKVANSKEDYREAIADYTEAIQLDSSDYEAYNYRGFARCLIHDYYEAIEDFDAAIELNPTYATAFNNRGAVFEELNMIEAAINDYVRAAWYEPYNRRFRKNLENAREKFAAK